MRFVTLCLLAIFGMLAMASTINPLAARDRSSSLEKRKGGGGGGRSSGSSSSSSGGRTSGGTTGSTGSAGGTSLGGSGTPRSYGGAYGGGATVPYKAGTSSPRGIGAGPLLGVGALGVFGFGGLWLYGAYLYSYPRPYGFYNRTANANQTKPVSCLCQEYNPCGCDQNDDSTYLSSVVGDGNPSSLNSTLIRVADVNGTSTIVLNGTLANDTTAADPNASAGVANFPPVVNAVFLAFAMGTALLAL